MWRCLDRCIRRLEEPLLQSRRAMASRARWHACLERLIARVERWHSLVQQQCVSLSAQQRCLCTESLQLPGVLIVLHAATTVSPWSLSMQHQAISAV